jgi:hypothetical protein
MIEWDDDKNRSNLDNHGLDFRDAEKYSRDRASHSWMTDSIMGSNGSLPWVCWPAVSWLLPRAARRGYADYLHEKSKPP